MLSLSLRFAASYLTGQGMRGTPQMDIFHQPANKKPGLHEKDRVFSTPPFTALHRRPIVKRIQAGVLTFGSSYLLAPSHPSPLLTLRHAQDLG